MPEKKKELGDKVAVADVEFSREFPLIRSSNKQKSEGELRRRKNQGKLEKLGSSGYLARKGFSQEKSR